MVLKRKSELLYRTFAKFIILLFLFLSQYSNTDGQAYDYYLDPTFDSGELFGQYPYIDEIYDMYLHEDGKITAIGLFDFDGQSFMSIGRIFSNGTKDNTLNTYFGGIPNSISYLSDYDSYLLTREGEVKKMFLDGEVHPYGEPYDSVWHFIYNSDDLFGNHHFYKTYVQPDSKILVAGTIQMDSTHVNPPDYRLLMRVFPDGRMDSTVVPLKSNYGYYPDYVGYIEPLGDGKYLVGGRFTGINGWPTVNIARLNADLTVDTTFSSPLDTASVWHDGIGQIIAVDSLNRYLINNITFSPNQSPPLSPVDTLHLIRLLSDGSLDTTFHWKYMYSEHYDERGHIITGLTTESGYILGGNFTSYNGVSCEAILEVDYDGNLLNTFENVHPEYPDMAARSPVIDVIRQSPEGNLYVGGNFVSFSGYTRINLVRLKRTTVGVATVKSPPVELKVYPNPAGEYLTMHYSVLFAKPQTYIEVYGATGILITRFECGRIKEGVKVWDTRNIVNGVYLVRFTQNGKTIETRKAVIQH